MHGNLSLVTYVRSCVDNKHIVMTVLLVSRRRNLNINSHFISCPCGLYINTKVCLVHSYQSEGTFVYYRILKKYYYEYQGIL